MKRWTVHGSPYADWGIYGESLPEAIAAHWEQLARKAKIGNAAGYQVVSVVAEYRKGILGGKGGVELTITHKGLDLAHASADPTPKRSTVWIYADPIDLPEPYTFSLNANS